jgi:hypothetical protein
MAGYTRQSVADIINGANITAPPLNAEFNQILAAFNSSTGHSHDGSTGNAPKIPLTTSVSGYLPVVHGGVGGRNNTTATSDPTATNDNTEGYAPGSLWINASTGYTHLCLYNTTNNANWVTLVAASFGTGIIAPKVTNTVDIGTATLQFKDVYVDGVGYIDDINAETMSSTGNTDVGGALAVTGNTTVGGTLGVSGLSTLASLGVTTTLTVGGSVGITGNTIMSGNLTVNGNTTIGNAASDTVTVTADVASHLIPSADSTYDLGATGSEWRNLYIDGTAKIDALEADTADIDGGSVDGTTVGAGTPASGSFAGLTATGTVNLSGATVSNLGAVTTADINGGTVDGVTLGTNSAVTEAQIDNININGNAITSTNSNGNIDLTPAGSGEVNISKVDINGGAIDGTTIGISSASSGAFTTVSTSGQATLATVDINGGVIDGTAIGSTTEASGAFTTLTSSGGITGSLSGNVTGNVTGNITGNVTGDLTGDVTGDVTGNITASSGLSTFNNVVVNGTANFTNTALTNVVDPTNAQDAATKNYVDTNDALKVTKAGDGMTGNLTMSGGAKVTGLPTPTANSDAATKGYVDTEVANLVDSAPGALDTLNELADALGDDPNFSATISAEIATKLPKAGGTMTGAIAMSTNKLTGVGNPTAAQDAATKSYVDTNDALKLNLTGGTMSGAIAMGSNKVTGVTDPTANQDASTKAYTDAQRDTRLATAGGTMTGNISIGANKITTSADPVNADDLARKSYVDTIHGSAVAAATSATNSANSATASANSASAALASQNAALVSQNAAAASYDLFDDRFLGAKSSAPTTDNDGGSLVVGTLYFDTTAQIMKVYGSSGWQSAGSAVNGTSERYKYTATNNQTTFSGADDNTNALGYDAGFLDVFLSGIRLVNGTDFTATSGTSIQLASGAATGDILEIVTYGTFVLSNQSLTDMTDVNTGGVSTNDVLAYNGTNFVPTSTPTFTSLTAPTINGTTRVNGELQVTAASGKDRFTIAPQAAGSGTFLISFNEASTGYEPVTFDFENLNLRTSGVSRLNITPNEIVANDLGTTQDFRVESNGNTHALFVDGGTSRVGINVAVPNRALDVHSGNASDITTFANDSGGYTFGHTSNLASWDLGASDALRFRHGSTETLRLKTTESVFNENGADLDFRVESDSNAHMLFVDGGNDKVVMGSSSIPVLNGSSTRTYDLVLDKGVAIGNSPYTHGYIGTDGTDGNVVITANSYSANLGGTRYVKITGGTAGGGGPNSLAELNGDTGAVFNEGSQDLDFRVESDANTHMLFVDGGTNRVHIGTTSGTGGNLVVASNSNANGIQILARTADDYGFLNWYNAAGSSQYGAIAGTSAGLFVYGPDGSETFRTGNSGTVFNEDGSDQDFRVESNAQSHMFFVDASQNRATFGQTQASITSGGMYMDLYNDSQAHIGICVSENANNSAGLYINRQNHDGSMIIFRRNNTQRGSIDVTTVGTTYSTTSDRRLKKDIETITDGTDKLMAMNPVTHGWKADPEADTVHGFIAQEMLDIVPEAVSGDPEGDEMMSMDYGRITPVIVAALQEANKKIAELENRINDLEGK